MTLLDRKKTNKSLEQCLIVLVSFICALLIGSVLLLLEKENPIEIYRTLFIQPLTSTSGIIKVLAKTTPLILAGLAVSLSFKCNVFNIGVEGQLYAGGMAAAVLGYYMPGLPSWLHILVCIVGAAAVGAFFAWIPAVLKVKLNVHEVISTIMLNYVISSLISWIVVSYFRYDGPTARTPNVAESARLFQFKSPELLNAGILIALVLCVVLQFVFKRTPLGWRIDSAGKNLTAARYAGIDSNRLILLTMCLSGAVAAMVGVERVLGAYGYMELNFSPGYGWDGITIAIIAANQPFGVLLMSLLLGLMSYGGTLINVTSGVPIEWIEVLNALIFIFVVMGKAILALRREKGNCGKRSMKKV